MSPDAEPVSPADPGRRRSRRWFLASGAAVVVGGGAGVGAGFLRHDARSPNPAPAALVAALAAERQLLALSAAAGRRDPSLRAVTATLLDDHRAHERALQSALARYDAPRPAPSPTASFAGRSAVREQLRAAERAAAADAAARAAGLAGPTATLLASISACESTHAELL